MNFLGIDVGTTCCNVNFLVRVAKYFTMKQKIVHLKKTARILMLISVILLAPLKN